MKPKTYLIISIVFLFSFTQCVNKGKKADSDKKTISINETELLIWHLEKQNLLNKPAEFGGLPQHILATSLAELLDSNIHIIDLRKARDYDKGHIKHATNLDPKSILNYFESDINSMNYDKIVLVCYNGHQANYLASILQVLGYNNVMVLKWGMCSWNRNFANGYWLNNTSDKYIDQLEKSYISKNPPIELPSIKTGQVDALQILKERANFALESGFDEFKIHADEIFENPDSFYIACYWPKIRYDFGHIPGAKHYQSGKSLHSMEELKTLPHDKPIVVYCNSGFKSANVVAYLRLLGFNAHSIVYGASSFMYSAMEKNDWKPFHPDYVNDFEYISKETNESDENIEF